MALKGDKDKNISLSDLRKLVKEYDDKREIGTFEKQTIDQFKNQVKLLQEVRNFSQSQKQFIDIYNKTEEKRRVNEEKQVKERLQRDGNFKAFLFQQTEGLRKTLHSSLDLKGADLGKGVVQGLNTFGLFGKFDTSGLIRKFDEYKAFTTERREKVADIKMIEKIEQMILKENKTMDEVKDFFKLNSITDRKSDELLYQFVKNYREQLNEIKNIGVLSDRGVETITRQARRKSLLEEKKKKDIYEEKEDVVGEGFVLSRQEEQKLIQRKSNIKQIEDIENIDVTKNIEEDNLNELVRQGKVLDEMNDNINIQAEVASDEMRLTEEWRNRQKEKTNDGSDIKKSNFMDMLGANFISDMITKYALPAILSWVASAGGLAVILGSASVIGSVATALGYLGHQASLKAFFNNPEFMNKVFYRPEAYKLSKTDTTLADIYGVKSELIEKAEKGITEDAITLREATEVAKKKFFEKGNKLTEEQSKRLKLATLEDELVRLKETDGTDKQMQDVITQIKTTRDKQTQISNKSGGNRQQGIEQKGNNVTGSYNNTVIQQQKQQSWIDLNDGVCRETGLNFVTSR